MSKTKEHGKTSPSDLMNIFGYEPESDLISDGGILKPDIISRILRNFFERDFKA